MQQLDDIFKVMLDVQKEYHSLLPAEEQERDEEWFDEVDHNICIFKQNIHCWIKDAELERKTSLSSRRSHFSGGSGRSSSKHSSKSSRSNKSSREERALAEKIKMVELMAEAKFMEERQSLVFQTERLKVAEEMAKTKGRVQILEEPCDEIVGRNEKVTGMRSLLQKTFNHQNDPGRSTAVSVDGNSSIVNMDSTASRESHVGYHKDVSRQDVSVRRIGMNGRPLQDQMKTREPVEDVHFGNRNSSNDEDANHKTSSVLCKLLQQQAASEVDIDCFDGNPLKYHYFMALFCEAVETKIEDRRGRLTRLLKYTVGEAKELIKHCIQLPHDKGYKYAKSLLEKTYGNPHKILSSYRKEVKDWPQVKFGDAKAFRKSFNFLLKCESVSDNQHWNALDTPEILCMLISKLPGVLMDRWNRKVQNIRRRESREPDLIDFVRFVKEEILLMNDPLFSREAFCEYAGQKEEEGKVKHKKLKNCYTKSEEKVTQNYSSVNPRKKCFL